MLGAVAFEPNQALIMLVAQTQNHWLARLTAGSVCLNHRTRERRAGRQEQAVPCALSWHPTLPWLSLKDAQPVNLTAETMRRLPELPMTWQDQKGPPRSPEQNPGEAASSSQTCVDQNLPTETN